MNEYLIELGVGYEFGKVEAPLLDHSVVLDVFETVFGRFVVETLVRR